MSTKTSEITRICVDATCPDCDYPELTGYMNMGDMTVEVYACGSRTPCGWTSSERPEED